MPARLPAPVLLLAWLAILPAPVHAVTRFDCDRPGTPLEASQLGAPPEPTCLSDGPTGGFLRLADTTVANINAVAFDLTDPGVHGMIVADFDFRMTPKSADSRADGFGFTLASTAIFGASGPVAGHSEEPNVAGSLGIGFDIHQGPHEVSPDHVSIHWDGQLFTEIDVTRLLDLASGQFIHARLIVRPGAFPPDVTILLTPSGSPPVTVVDRLPVPGLVPYESRVQLMARSGGEAALHDIDNLNVQFVDVGQNVVSVGRAAYEANEGGEAIVTVTRAGNPQTTATVHYRCEDLSATAGEDYTPVSGALTFAAGENTKTLRVPILDDSNTEGDEHFLLALEDPQGAVLGGPDQAQVTIVDDEAARSTGRWSGVIGWPIVAIHGQALPDGRVMMWPRGEGPLAPATGDDAHVWDPATGEIAPVARAGFDIFCGGHSLTTDGRVFVAGGHVHEFVGLSRATLYDAVHDTWTDQPDMNAGRWYPTTTVLPNGEVLVTSGTIDTLIMNEVPQVLAASGGAWRTLTGARLGEPDLAATYPWMYVIPDGRVFCAGWQQATGFLDTRGAGSWTSGPPSHFGRRDYGTSVMYEPGKVLIAGGNPRNAAIPSSLVPTARAEVIDLTTGAPAWREVDPMALPRRQLNSTLLPDGTVLVTGGTSSPGFNDATAPALTAELWDPGTEHWTTLAAMQTARLYHSIALLLPDGRVLCAGGGFPPATGSVNHDDAEIFSPPYLFKGPRPVITSAPAAVSYGQAFPVETPDGDRIATVRWIRLSSVTHDYNQSQRSNVLPFSVVRGGLYTTAPPDSNLCPPGHYLLFILNRNGVPSVGRVVQITRPAGGSPVPGTRGLSLAGARPNPAIRGLTIAFALAGDAPAELTVFDLSGRRILTRDVSGLGPGEHVIDVGTPPGLKPGVYMIRLTQAGESVTKQAIVLQP